MVRHPVVFHVQIHVPSLSFVSTAAHHLLVSHLRVTVRRQSSAKCVLIDSFYVASDSQFTRSAILRVVLSYFYSLLVFNELWTSISHCAPIPIKAPILLPSRRLSLVQPKHSIDILLHFPHCSTNTLFFRLLLHILVFHEGRHCWG